MGNQIANRIQFSVGGDVPVSAKNDTPPKNKIMENTYKD